MTLNNVDLAQKPLSLLSFCSGYGGIERGLELAGVNHRVIAYVEIEAYAIANLVAKMEQGELDPAPIWTDIKTFPAEVFRDRVDILTAGYPCQPHSQAGERKGAEDPRDLWPAIWRHIGIIHPGKCLFENVEGHVSSGLSTVIADLESDRYRTTWGIFSAVEVGAPHQRKRAFILADSNPTLRNRAERNKGRRDDIQTGGQAESEFDGEESFLANSSDQGRRRERSASEEIPESTEVERSARCCGTVSDADRGRQQEQRQPEHREQQCSPRSQSEGCGDGRGGKGQTANSKRILSEAGTESTRRQERTDPGRRSERSTVGNAECPERRPRNSRRNELNRDDTRRQEGSDRSRETGEGVADAISSRESQSEGSIEDIGGRSVDSGEEVSNSSGNTSNGSRETRKTRRRQQTGRRGGESNTDHWTVEPPVGRVAHGSPFRVDQLRLLGNGVVPQTAAKAWTVLNSRFEDDFA